MFIKNSEKVAMYTRNGNVTYSKLLSNTAFYAALYKSHEKNQKIAIFFENRVEWFYAFLSTWEREFIPLPIDYLSSSEEVEYILKDSETKSIFCSNETLTVTKDAVKKVKHKVKIYNVDEIKIDNKDYISAPMPDLHPEDTSVIIYTSGTTGSPKGVMLTYDNIMANIESVSCKERNFFNADTQTMVLLPLHHTFPLMGTFLAPLNQGGSCVFCPKLTGEEIMKSLAESDLTVFIGVPRLYEMFKNGIEAKIQKSAAGRVLYSIAGRIGSEKFSKLVFKSVHKRFGEKLVGFVSGGAALDAEIGKFYKTLGFRVFEGYGMTETAPMITCPSHKSRDIGHVGIPIQSTEVKIEDGEILCRGRNVMKGYYKRPKETEEILRGGWLHTGDLGYFDKKGFLHITGRRKEIIVLPNGKNVNPGEVEAKLASISKSIKEAGVFDQGGILKAIIFPDIDKLHKDGVLNIEEHIQSEVITPYNKKVSPYKKISSFFLTLEELPRTRLGKIKRFLLPELVIKNKTAPVQEDGSIDYKKSETYQEVSRYLETETGSDVAPEDHIEIDLGLDSLDKISLLAFIKNRFGLDMSEEDLLKNSYIKGLVAYIQKHGSLKGGAQEHGRNWGFLKKKRSEGVKIQKSGFPHILLKQLFGLLIHSISRVTVKGKECLPRSPFILAPNHLSNVDWLLLASTLDNKTVKKSYIFAKEKHFKTWWKRFIALRTNIILMDINKDLNSSIQTTADILKMGNNLGIFPEGTRSNDGKLGSFKKIFAILSKELNVPVVPVVIKGSNKVLPPKSSLPRIGQKLEMEYLMPVYPGSKSYEEIVKEVRGKIQENLGN